MSTDRQGLGDPILDRMLDGGLPETKATLLSGDAGTGKSTLAMQYLQEGIENGEQCLYISTEQTPEEIRDSFDGFDYNLDHPNLTIGTIQARPGQVQGERERQLTVQSLEGGTEVESFGDLPFEPKYIEKHIEQFGPADRIVIDSMSGLNVLTDDPYRYQRFILDLIQFLTDEMDATALLTSESPDGTEGTEKSRILRFAVHGVISLDMKTIGGSRKRFLEIEKMRGTDHDTRSVVMRIDEGGVTTGPVRRSQPPALKDHNHEPIGLDGLDALCGGGLVKGTGVLLGHDGRVNLKALLSRILDHGIEDDYRLLITTTPELGEDSMRTIFEQAGTDLDAMLDRDKITVIDLLGTWSSDHDNIARSIEENSDLKKLLRRFADDTDPEEDTMALLNIDGIARSIDLDAAENLRYLNESLSSEDDFLIYLLNRELASDELIEYYIGNVSQSLHTFLDSDGLQFITLEKSPCGFVGSTSLVEYLTDPPYVSVEEPPMDRENPKAQD